MNVVRIDERVALRAEGSPDDTTTSPGERARVLMREARGAALEQLETLEAAIQVVRDLALDVTVGADAYGVGVRDLASRLAEDLLWRGKSLAALTARERAGLLAH